MSVQMDNLRVDAVAAGGLSHDLLATELVESARKRAKRRLGASEERVAWAVAAAFVAAAVCMAAFLPQVRPFSATTAVVAILAYAIASRVQFEVHDGFAAPTQLVLVPMFLALPPRVVPLLVAAGYLVGHAVRPNRSLSHAPIAVATAWYSTGPALVLALASHATPSWHETPLYVGALAAQFCADFLISAPWSRLMHGVRIPDHLRSMRETALVDIALSPVALGVGLSVAGRAWGTLVVLPLVGLLYVFARERQHRLDHAVELSNAYRGTAMLLGEMIEADDEYTGSHSRDVVDLVLGVADRLGLDQRTRRHAEFAALLHDVGKVKVPSEIINKAGPLDDDEWALMRTHTILGEEMLTKVGGLLGEIGHIVRSSHERWDGGGYPDGLAGDEIPIAARIVSACDAWSAMTTDRAYRRRLSRHEAQTELRACAGTQFDEIVVAALLTVIAA